ncbi:MAG: glycine zipper 2TM domain-containing protein [Usitatibacter sp.]
MKTIVLTAAGACALLGFAASASAQVYGDTARVLSSTPIYDRVVTPRRECHMEQVTAYEESRTVREPESRVARNEGGIGPGAVVGAIVGGVIGHQLGGSSAGRDHGTAAGAVVGGLIGNSIERDADSADRGATREVVVDRVPVTRDVQRCNTIADAREAIVGYDVRYEYNGHEFTTRLAYDPGQQLPVNVEVRPPQERASAIGPRTPIYRGTY